jgi:hypothetical protein
MSHVISFITLCCYCVHTFNLFLFAGRVITLFLVFGWDGQGGIFGAIYKTKKKWKTNFLKKNRKLRRTMGFLWGSNPRFLSL